MREMNAQEDNESFVQRHLAGFIIFPLYFALFTLDFIIRDY